jgi:hypothetical protein
MEYERMLSNQDMPKWDVAIASLANDHYRKKTGPLTLDDFRNLAREHAMRLDDIMETMFLLAIHREWEYSDASGEKRPLDQQTLDGLYVKRRLSEEDLSSFDGSWQPTR